MGCEALSSYFCSPRWVVLNSSLPSSSSFKPITAFPIRANPISLRPQTPKTRATLDDRDQTPSPPLLVQEEEQVQAQSSQEVEEIVEVLKSAAKTKKVAAEEVLSALSVIEKAKVDPTGFLDTLGGTKSPGRTWMLIFTAQDLPVIARGTHHRIATTHCIFSLIAHLSISQQIIIFSSTLFYLC